MTFGEFMRAFEKGIRRVLYGPTPDISAYQKRHAETNQRVEELHEAIRKIDDRVTEIERSPNPWQELERTIKSNHSGNGEQRQQREQ